MRFDLPLPANVANLRVDWRQRNRLRQVYYADCDRLQLAGLVPPPPDAALTAVGVHAHFRVGNRMDPDNMRARCKWALDWLRTRGYIVDDKSQVVRRFTDSQEIDRKAPGLEITLQPLED